MVVFSDAGSQLWESSVDAWSSVIQAMRGFDVLAVVEPDFQERRYTKRSTFESFKDALGETGAAMEGQFITGIFVLRKTAASMRLLDAWEKLVQQIQLVDETRADAEDSEFVAHRHEQSVWSLLIKSAILGKRVRLDADTEPVNVSARVLTILSGFEIAQLVGFARKRD